MKRKFYFIRDSVTGNFYGGGNINDFVSFDKAEVYLQRKDAENKIKFYGRDKYVVGNWLWYEDDLNSSISKEPQCVEYYKRIKKLVDERKGLPDWGMEIIEIEIGIP